MTMHPELVREFATLDMIAADSDPTFRYYPCGDPRGSDWLCSRCGWQRRDCWIYSVAGSQWDLRDNPETEVV